MRLAGEPLEQGLGETRLADARLARNQHDAALAALGLLPAALQERQLLVPADERRGGPCSASKRLSAVLSPSTCQTDGLGEALKGDLAEIAIIEQAAHLPPGGSVDHHLTRSREAL